MRADAIVVLNPFLAWLQTTRIATTVAQSQLLTGFISGTHLLGMTLLVGGALVSGLVLLGVMPFDRPVAGVASVAARGVTVGLAVSVFSGLLLFAPRASAAAHNGFFQIKVLLLLTASAFHFGWLRPGVRRDDTALEAPRLAGGYGLVLWFGVALAGAAYILLE